MKTALILAIIFTAFSVDSFTQDLLSWRRLESPAARLLNKVFFIDSLHGWAGGDGGTIIETHDAGETWNVLHSSADTYILDLFFLDSTRGWVLYWDANPPFASKMLKTTNAGLIWDTLSCPGENPFFYSIVFQDTLTGFLAGPPFLKTTNGGENWYECNVSDIDTVPPDISHLPVKSMKFFSDSIGYASGGYLDLSGVMWTTRDRGEHWTAKGLGKDPIYDFFIFDTLNAAALTGDPEGLFTIAYIKTVNGGLEWEFKPLELYGTISSIAFRTYEEGWALKEDKFIVTTDNGKTWNEFPEPDSVFLQDITFTDSLTGYAVGSEGSIYKYKINPPLTVTEYGNMTGPYRLMQNYPNPFNPSTTILYEISSPANVELSVYNVLGERILTLVNEMQGTGLHKCVINEKHLSAGIYFYKIRSGDFTAVRKMVLTR